MYSVIESIIGHTWQSNYTSDQQYIYYIAGALIVIFSVVFVDLIYRVFTHFWRGGK